MERKEILENLENYINLKNTDYAIMIDGENGVGKTFFIKNDLQTMIEKLNYKIEEENEKEKAKEKENKKQNKTDKNTKKEKKYRFVYVSLFGVSSTLEVDEEIINSLGTNVTKNLTKNAKDWVKDKFKSLTKKHNKQDDVNNRLIDNKVIIVFDDLDRMKMDVVTLLGHFNKYVEHNKSKAIFVANEKELAKLNLSANKEQKLIAAMNTPEYIDFLETNKSNNKDCYIDEMNKVLNDSCTNLFVTRDLYNTTKEKVIGKTFMFEMNFNNIIEEIINPLLNKQDELKVIDENSIEYVNKIAMRENHYNIRTMKCIIEICSYYFRKIEKLSKDNDKFQAMKNDKNYKNEIFKQFVVCTIMYKKNITKYDDMVCAASYKEIKKQRDNDGYSVFESAKEMLKSGSFNEELVKEEYSAYLEYNEFIKNED